MAHLGNYEDRNFSELGPLADDRDSCSGIGETELSESHQSIWPVVLEHQTNCPIPSRTVLVCSTEKELMLVPNVAFFALWY